MSSGMLERKRSGRHEGKTIDYGAKNFSLTPAWIKAKPSFEDDDKENAGPARAAKASDKADAKRKRQSAPVEQPKASSQPHRSKSAEPERAGREDKEAKKKAQSKQRKMDKVVEDAPEEKKAKGKKESKRHSVADVPAAPVDPKPAAAAKKPRQSAPPAPPAAPAPAPAPALQRGGSQRGGSQRARAEVPASPVDVFPLGIAASPPQDSFDVYGGGGDSPRLGMAQAAQAPIPIAAVLAPKARVERPAKPAPAAAPAAQPPIARANAVRPAPAAMPTTTAAAAAALVVASQVPLPARGSGPVANSNHHAGSSVCMGPQGGISGGPGAAAAAAALTVPDVPPAGQRKRPAEEAAPEAAAGRKRGRGAAHGADNAGNAASDPSAPTYNYTLALGGVGSPIRLKTPNALPAPALSDGAASRAAFFRLQELHEDLQRRYRDLQHRRTAEAEAAFADVQARAQRATQAAQALADRWKQEAERQAGFAQRSRETESDNRALTAQLGELRAALCAMEAQRLEAERRLQDREKDDVARDATRQQEVGAVAEGVQAVMAQLEASRAELESSRAALARSEKERAEDSAAFVQLMKARDDASRSEQETTRAERERREAAEARAARLQAELAAVEAARARERAEMEAQRERGATGGLLLLTGLAAESVADRPGTFRYTDAVLGFSFELGPSSEGEAMAEGEEKADEGEVEYRPLALGTAEPFLPDYLHEAIIFGVEQGPNFVSRFLVSLHNAREAAAEEMEAQIQMEA